MIVSLTILFSGFTAIITGIHNHTENIKIPIILLNATISLLIGFESSFKISERTANFAKHSQSYNKLSHDIDKELNKWSHNKIDNSNEKLIDFLNLTITLYDNITDGITDEFPHSIIKDVKKLYEDLDESYLPLILEKKYNPSPTNSSNNLTENNSPKRLPRSNFLPFKNNKNNSKRRNSLSNVRKYFKSYKISNNDENSQENNSEFSENLQENNSEFSENSQENNSERRNNNDIRIRIDEDNVML